MTFAIGTVVRFTPAADRIGGMIDPGAIGKVTGTHDIFATWPVVYFPRGTFGPYSEFAFTRPDEELTAIDPDTLSERDRYALGV